MEDDFEFLGISREFMDFPKVADQYDGLLVILGSGKCVWEDYLKVDREHDIMCVNDIIMHFPERIAHAYSNDHRMLPHWVRARRPRLKSLYGEIKHVHTNKTQPAKLAAHVWPWPGHGSSGLNAVYTGIGLGYDEIWLCGIPLDNSGHYFDPPWIRTNFINEVSQRNMGNGDAPKHWGMAKRRIFKGRVKSFSGRTKDLLGSPEEK